MSSIHQETDRERVLAAAARLIATPEGATRLATLPVACTTNLAAVRWAWVTLPHWAIDLVPTDRPGFFLPIWDETADWRSYPWWKGAAALLSCKFERAMEATSGPVHSYAFRLGDDVQPIFDYAWVNRIVLFLRRWWSVENGVEETAAFGPVPRAIVHLTHDVDAISKTLAIRGKQAAFSLYNQRPGRAARFLLGRADYWQFDRILALEEAYGRRSLWTFYGGKGGWLRRPRELLMDPSYSVGYGRLRQQVRALAEAGHRVGLHPRFDTWRDTDLMIAEKRVVEAALGAPITEVRQHWLRFSFAETWRAQAAAGLTHDLTLGFNDRPGFRAGAALSHIDPESGMRVTPMVLMDSHLYDYADMAPEVRHQTIDRMLDELVATGGEASVIWHQRVFHPDYGWAEGYEYLLAGLHSRRIGQPGDT